MISARTPSHRWAVGLTTVAMALGIAGPAAAISPRNPYRSFNLSGINYGSMRWERTHRSGTSSRQRTSRRGRSRRSTRGSSVTQLRSPGVVVGGVSGGTVVGGTSSRTQGSVSRSP